MKQSSNRIPVIAVCPYFNFMGIRIGLLDDDQFIALPDASDYGIHDWRIGRFDPYRFSIGCLSTEGMTPPDYLIDGDAVYAQIRMMKLLEQLVREENIKEEKTFAGLVLKRMEFFWSGPPAEFAFCLVGRQANLSELVQAGIKQAERISQIKNATLRMLVSPQPSERRPGSRGLSSAEREQSKIRNHHKNSSSGPPGCTIPVPQEFSRQCSLREAVYEAIGITIKRLCPTDEPTIYQLEANPHHIR